jgi:hypothetical protein
MNISPANSSACFFNIPTFGLPKVTVHFALIQGVNGAPVSGSKPEGRSTERIGTEDSFALIMNSAILPLGSPLMLVPNNASMIKSYLDKLFTFFLG